MNVHYDNEDIPSPCVRNCCLNDDDVCVGCFRKLQEITRWGVMNDAEKQSTLAAAALRKEKEDNRMSSIPRGART